MIENNVQTEQQAQETVRLLYVAGQVAVALIFALIGWNGHPNFMLFGWLVQGIVHLMIWPPIRANMEYRMKVVAFKQLYENVFVFSRFPDDDTVSAYWDETLDFLKEVGNQHDVRVYMAIFQDVVYYVGYVDAQGKRHTERKNRDKGASYQSWEEYQAWIETFQKLEMEELRVRLRRDGKGFAWVNEKIFNQHVSRN